MAAVPYYFETHTAASLVGLILSIVLIANGVGLLMVRRWAYNLGVVYGWLSIAYQVAWSVYYFLVVMPVVMASLDNAAPPLGFKGQAQAFRDAVKIGATVDAVMTPMGLLYPIFVLIMLVAIRKAFRRPKPAPEGDEEAGVGEAAPGVEERPHADLPPGYEPDDRIGPAPT
jgi:hypothetical protein